MFQFQSKLVIIHFKSYKQSVNNLLFDFSIFLFYFEQSGFESWLGTLYCVLGRDTLLSQCLSIPSVFNIWGYPCDGLASHPVGSRNTPSRFMLQKLE